MRRAAAALCALSLAACVHDVARVQTGDTLVEIAHTSVLRRGCHEASAEKGAIKVSLVAQDLSASRELAAALAALAEAMGDEKSEACTPVSAQRDE